MYRVVGSCDIPNDSSDEINTNGFEYIDLDVFGYSRVWTLNVKLVSNDWVIGDWSSTRIEDDPVWDIDGSVFIIYDVLK